LPEVYEQFRDDMIQTYCFRSRNNSCIAHFHSSIELVYVLQGVMSAVLDGQRYDVSKGQLLIASSYDVHRYFTEEMSDVIVIIIPVSFVPSLQKALASQRFAKSVYTDASGEMATLVPLMHSRWEHLGCDARQGFSQLILGMLIDRVGLKSIPIQVPTGLVRNMLLYLQENYASPLTMDDLAHHFGYSRSRLSHIFRDNFGCSYSQYKNGLRCREAARLLAESDLTQLEISLMTGFECIRTFYRAFRQCYGMTPKEYMQSLNHPVAALAQLSKMQETGISGQECYFREERFSCQ